jgi:hypothetical protein
MLAAHPDAAASATDPWVAQEWTGALVLRLAAEFQGYCRALHDDAIDAVLDVVTVPRGALQAVLINGLSAGRGLDRRSADPKTISDDFDRLGCDLWVSLGVRRPVVARAWREVLALLHIARNGLAHDDLGALARVEAAGWPVDIATVRNWRNVLDDIATEMNDGVGADIAELIGKIPWEKG